jgi:excinuclease UvrABC nuclease subunit
MPVTGDCILSTEESLQDAPDSPGVYQLESQGEVVYVGMAADSIRRRLRDHLVHRTIDCSRTATYVRVEQHVEPAARLEQLLRENLVTHGRLPKCNDVIPRSHRRWLR